MRGFSSESFRPNPEEEKTEKDIYERVHSMEKEIDELQKVLDTDKTYDWEKLKETGSLILAKRNELIILKTQRDTLEATRLPKEKREALNEMRESLEKLKRFDDKWVTEELIEREEQRLKEEEQQIKILMRERF